MYLALIRNAIRGSTNRTCAGSHRLLQNRLNRIKLAQSAARCSNAKVDYGGRPLYYYFLRSLSHRTEGEVRQMDWLTLIPTPLLLLAALLDLRTLSSALTVSALSPPTTEIARFRRV